MKMTYISPAGQKVTAGKSGSQNVPKVDVSTGEAVSSSVTSSASFVNQNRPSASSPNLNSAEEFRKFIEVEVLKIIKNLAEEGKTTRERIQEIARRTLDLIKPGMTIDELYQNAVKLDDQHPELAPVVYAVMKEYEQKYEKKAIEQVSAFVKAGKYDEAQNLVKKVLQFKIDS